MLKTHDIFSQTENLDVIVCEIAYSIPVTDPWEFGEFDQTSLLMLACS